MPAAEGGSAYRCCPLALAGHIRFIERAQELGFMLDQIEGKLADLRRMQRMLRAVLQEHEHANLRAPCPITATPACERVSTDTKRSPAVNGRRDAIRDTAARTGQ